MISLCAPKGLARDWNTTKSTCVAFIEVGKGGQGAEAP